MTDIPFTNEEIAACPVIKEETTSATHRNGVRSGLADAGAPPNNIAPQNCIPDDFLPLRHGIDSLYLSYGGELKPEARQRLEALKIQAQSETDAHLAQICIGQHIFEVRDKGRKGFDYVLIDGHYEIQLNSSPTSTRPVAYVKISSDCLASVDIVELEPRLRATLKELCLLSSLSNTEPYSETVSRADFYLDFCCHDDRIINLNQNNFISRASVIRPYFTNHVLSGWDIGLGGNLCARIYNKTLEIEKSGKGYLKGLWVKSGWDGKQTVWRIEFQVRRPIFAEYEIRSLPQVLAVKKQLWTYFIQEWLRLAIPNAKDKTRSRWLTNPLWDGIWEAVCDEYTSPLLKRKKLDRAPDENSILQQIINPLASWMALKGITDPIKAIKLLAELLPDQLKIHRTAKDIRLFDVLVTKAKQKIRLFNLSLNSDEGLYDKRNLNSFPVRNPEHENT